MTVSIKVQQTEPYLLFVSPRLPKRKDAEEEKFSPTEDRGQTPA